MTTYYVRASMGNDGNTGLSPAQAWLTIDYAANQVAASDTVYIGSGIYREMVTMDTSGTSGNSISFVGDVTGEHTGDGGLVVISSHDANTDPCARNYCVHSNEKNFIVLQNLILQGGEIAALGYSGATGHLSLEGWQVLDCSIFAGEHSADYAAFFKINNGAEPATEGIRIERTVFMGSLRFEGTGQAVGHIDMKVTIQNCSFHRGTDAKDFGIELYLGTGTYHPGGFDIFNCFFNGVEDAIYLYNFNNTTHVSNVMNCLFIGCYMGCYGITVDDAAILLDYNIFSGCAYGVYEGTDGGHNNVTPAVPLLGGFADHMLVKALGWSPYKFLEPITLVDGTTPEPGVGFASATYAPADDMYGNPRPMGRNADDVGPVEARRRGQNETGTVRTSSHSMAIKGQGYHDVLLAVDAALTTVTVYGRYDANYTGDLPLLEVLNIPGDTDKSDAMAGAAGAWEAIACIFTPTSAGYVRVRVRSRDTSADGECFFDDMVVS